MVWSGKVWYGMVWRGVAWYGVVWCCVAWRGVAWNGLVWVGSVRCGVGWGGMARHGTAWYGIVWCRIHLVIDQNKNYQTFDGNFGSVFCIHDYDYIYLRVIVLIATVSDINIKDQKLSWCQLCCHWRHRCFIKVNGGTIDENEFHDDYRLSMNKTDPVCNI